MTIAASMKLHQGRTLIELMISLLLGLFLMGQLVYIYTNNKATYRLQNGMNRVMENANFLSHIMAKDIRMAGYQGCESTGIVATSNIITSPPEDAVFTQDDVITGYEATTSSTWSPALPTSLTGAVAGGTDVLIIRKSAARSVQLDTPMVTPTDALSVPSRLNFSQGDILFITDCDSADIFQAGLGTNSTSITHTATENDTASLTNSYGVGSMVSNLESYIYFIQDTGRDNATGSNIFGLFRRDINGTTIELAEGVSDMEIVYGVDTSANGSVDSYLTAQQVVAGNNWPNVKSINVRLLLDSIEAVNPKPQPYRFNGATITPADNRLYRERSIYVTLRNRSL